MNYQRIIAGASVGAALTGLGFLLFHPIGKKFRKKAVDLGLDAADKLIDYIRTTSHQAAEQNVNAGTPEVHSMM